jgi:ribosome-associated protein
MVMKSRRRRAAELATEQREALGVDSVEQNDDEGPSRSARKRESHELRDLGWELTEVRPDRLASLALPSDLLDAVAEARRLRSFGARKRQAQYIGKLMRRLDAPVIAAIRKGLDALRQ